MIKFIKSKKLFLVGLAIIVLTAWADLYSKKEIFRILDEVAIKEAAETPQIKITGFFNLVKVWNRGISFGMFNKAANPKYYIIAVNLVIMLILLVWLYQIKHIYFTCAVSLIIGGALGNLIDRIQNNAVADFLDFYYSSYHWPAFNIADSMVFIGVALLLTENLFVKNEKK